MDHERYRNSIQPVAEKIMTFVSKELTKTIIRDDYRESLELTEYFISADRDKIVRVPSPEHCIMRDGCLEQYTA